MDIELCRFRDGDAEEIVGWVQTAAEAQAWAGNATPYPVAPKQFSLWHAEPDVRPWTARRNGTLLAYGELWLDRAGDEVELARLLVHPQHRGRGIGRRFTSQLINRAIAHSPNIFLRVLPDNEPAIRCYQAAGFARVSQADEDAFNEGQPQAYIWMKYVK